MLSNIFVYRYKQNFKIFCCAKQILQSLNFQYSRFVCQLIVLMSYINNACNHTSRHYYLVKRNKNTLLLHVFLK